MTRILRSVDVDGDETRLGKVVGRVIERLERCRRYFMKLCKERGTEDGNDVEQLERERVASRDECLHVED